MRRSMQLKAAHACLRYHRRRSSDAGMQASFDHAHSCRLLRDDGARLPVRRSIVRSRLPRLTAVSSRAPASCLRHCNGWLDAEMLRQVDVTATHWRYRRRMRPPISCC